MVIGIAVILSLYFIFTREKKPVAETPIVSVMPASQQNVQIFGEYVGRIRAQQFVEVRARVEGFLEQMLFEEGTSVKRNQVLFVINQDQYRAKADKVRAQLKKIRHRRKKRNVTWNVSARCMNKMRPASWTWTMRWLLTKQL